MDDHSLIDEDRELIQALANQAAVAVHLTRLDEQAREAAVAREREEQAVQRAEALARIGEASRSTLQRLSEKPDIDGFLDHVLTVCAEQFGACGGRVWLHENEDTNRVVLTLENSIVRKSEDSRHPGARRSNYVVDDLLRIRERRGEVWQDGEAEFQEARYAPFREYLEAHNIRAILTIPMFFGEEYRGSLTLRFTEQRRLAPEEEELAHALANQAVLALEMRRLANEARDDCGVGTGGAGDPAGGGPGAHRRGRAFDPAAAVGEARHRWLPCHVLTVCAEQFGAVGGGVWLDSSATTQLAVTVEGGQVRRGASSRHPGRQKTQVLFGGDDATRIWAFIEAQQQRGSLYANVDSLVRCLEVLVDSYRRSGEMRVVLEVGSVPLSGSVARELTAIAQEAVNNALRHAKPGKIVIRCFSEDEVLILSVADDGCGFEVDPHALGFGLASMRGRAEYIGADFTLESAPGRGTTIAARLALAGQQERGEDGKPSV